MQTPPPKLLRLHLALDDVGALAPGNAAGVWVQGCDRYCRGCMSPDTFDPVGGQVATIEAVAAWLRSTGRSNLMLSGGEPFDQAGELVALIDLVRTERPWLVACYTGHRLEDLRLDGDPGALLLLSRIDLLIDGPYMSSRHASLLWRGSTNQRIHNLTHRVELPAEDESVGLEVHFDGHGSWRLIGVPPVRHSLETVVAINPRIVPVEATPSAAPLPFPTEEVT